jgi:hypothetical protein
MTSRLQTVLTFLNTTAVLGMGFVLVSQQRDTGQELEDLRAQVRKTSESANADAAGRRAAAETAMRLWATQATRTPPAPAGGTRTQAQAPEAPNAEELTAPDEVPPPPPMRPPPATFEQSRKKVLAAFDEEPVDAAWSGRAERTLDEVMRQHLPANSRVKALDCRATLCRVELVHRSAADSGPFMRSGLRTWPGSVFVASETQEGSDYVVTLIASKEGTNPPL